MRQQFLEKILPAQGIYCAATITKDGAITHHFSETLNDLIKSLDGSPEANVYFSPITYTGYSRSSETAKLCQSFFVDLDVGDNKNYPSQQAALEDLDKFCNSNDLPPPIKVNSGTGIQAYWPFTEPVPVEEWRPYAKLFKQFCLSHGLKIDPTVTADAARIMRAPDTYNQKTTPPKPTSVLDKEFNQYDFSLFKEFLGPLPANQLAVLAAAPRGLDAETKAMLKLDNFETVFRDIVLQSMGSQEGPGCAQIAHIIINSRTLSYGLWFSGLSIAARCVDADEAIHLMSENYNGYNRENTEFKARETLKASGPHLCATFDAENPGICPSCPHWGKLSPQSPIALGRKLKTAPAASDAIWTAEFIPKVADWQMPKEIFPFVRGAVSGGIYYQPPPEPGESGAVEHQPPELLIEHDFYPIKRMYSENDGETLVMRLVLPRDGVREFDFPTKFVYVRDRLLEIVAKRGLYIKPANLGLLMDYILKWASYMVNIKTAEQIRAQMGWTDNRDAFVIGKMEIHEDGNEYPAPASPWINNVAKLLVPTGSYEAWREAADMLNEPMWERHAFALLCGFGSPLMCLTSTSGACVCFYGKSGTAKTGAMYAGLSVFGNPKELSTFEYTDAGMVGRMLGLHNIMFGLDEASKKDPKHVSAVIHRISSGKGKIRMQASVNAERPMEMSASIIGFLASNHALQDKLELDMAAPDGEMARLIEFYIDPESTPLHKKPRLGKQIFETFRHNYGFAGPMFIKYIYKVGFAYATEKVNKWTERFISDFGDAAAYRFYENLIGAVFGAGELANEAGILKIDLDRTYIEVMRHLVATKDNVKLNSDDYSPVVAEYMMKYQQNFLVVDKARVIVEPKGELRGRIESDTGLQYIPKGLFKEFLSIKQISSKEFEISAKAKGLLLDNKKYRITGGWRAGMGTSPVWVYVFKEDLKDLTSAITSGG